MSGFGAVQEKKWHFYQDNKGEWRWNTKSKNGREIGASTEGYKNKADCIKNAKKFGYKD